MRLYNGEVRKKMRVHRIVALHFIPNPENKTEVNHIDGTKKNNRAENLEWTTRQENAKHAKDLGLYIGKRKNGGSRLQDCC